jgi:alpha-galactosidase
MIHLSQADTSILFDLVDDTISIPYWGRALKSFNDDLAKEIARATTKAGAHGGLDVSPRNLILKEHSRGCTGHPALRGHRDGVSVANWFVLKSHVATSNTLVANFEDTTAGLAVSISYQLHDSGILTVDASIQNITQGNYSLEHLISWLPLTENADEILDFYGHWTKERQPQRRPLGYGLTSREGFEGRSGHDYTITQIALNHSTGFHNGEAWSMGVAWSGNNIHHVERLVDGNRSIGAGEYLLPGEVILAEGETYQAPQIIASYSSQGLDGITHNYYSYIRARKKHPTNIRPRPLTLNMWEAVYFDHNFEKIKGIIDKAAEVGVERVVLDDGWFGSRRDDSSGLGDWVISPDVWPNGLSPLAEYANSKGIEFGLWFEGEMVQANSDVYRAHPDWILQESGRTPVEGRRQQVLNLTHPAAYEHVLKQVDEVLSSCNIAYIKWDHNRHLTDPISGGHAVVRKQTQAIYRLFDELKSRHPGLEIESCSSGGGRVDLGMIEHADRFWTSDQNDALERQSIQRWTALVIPPELLGTHVGPTLGHQTGRTHHIHFRAINALFGHAGIEWNITEATETELKTLKAFAKFYKAHRELLHSGRVIRADDADESSYLYGTVAQDQSEAIFSYMQLKTFNDFIPQTARITGLQHDALYRVEIVEELSAIHYMQKRTPGWWPSVTLPGDVLASVGLQMPGMLPENGLLFHLTRI